MFNCLLEEARDFIIPAKYKIKGRDSAIMTEWKDCFTSCVKVTSGSSCYKDNLGYRINENQTLASFFSKIFPTSMEAKIRECPDCIRTSVDMSHSVFVGSKSASGSLHISFRRTERVPKGEKVYSPPEGLGTFPLFSTYDYRDKLPTNVASHGGLFFPMFDSEAMYIAFESLNNAKFAIRPFFGGINGISGNSLFDELRKNDTQSPDSRMLSGKQDYIVTPEQKRLDGVAIAPGIMRQFVATKPTSESKRGSRHRATEELKDFEDPYETLRILKVDSGSIESQITGRDSLGGVQLQIIPQFVTTRMFAGNVKDACPPAFGRPLESYQPIPDTAQIYDVLKTPKELHITLDDSIYFRDMRLEREDAREKTVADLAAEAGVSSGVVDLVGMYDASPSKVVSVTADGSHGQSVLFNVRSRISSLLL